MEERINLTILKSKDYYFFFEVNKNNNLPKLKRCNFDFGIYISQTLHELAIDFVYIRKERTEINKRVLIIWIPYIKNS